MATDGSAARASLGRTSPACSLLRPPLTRPRPGSESPSSWEARWVPTARSGAPDAAALSAEKATGPGCCGLNGRRGGRRRPGGGTSRSPWTRPAGPTPRVSVPGGVGPHGTQPAPSGSHLQHESDPVLATVANRLALEHPGRTLPRPLPRLRGPHGGARVGGSSREVGNGFCPHLRATEQSV